MTHLPSDDERVPSSAAKAAAADHERPGDLPPWAAELMVLADAIDRARKARTPSARGRAIGRGMAIAREALLHHAPDFPIPRPLPGTRDLGPVLAFSEFARERMPHLSSYIRFHLLRIHAALSGVKVADLPDPNAARQTIMAILDANQVARPELDGFSRADVARIIQDDWSGTGPVRLHPEVVGDDRESIDFLRLTDRLLRWFDRNGPVPAGRPPALPDAVLQRLVVDLREDEDTGAGDAEDELAITALSLRLSVDLGLVVRRKGKLALGTTGRRMLDAKLTGALYEALFTACFHGLDTIGLDEFPGREAALNSNIAWVIFRVHELARAWTPSRRVAKAAWPPELRDPTPPVVTAEEHRQIELHVFFWRVLAPLQMFGLLELDARARVRATPLFGEFFEVRRELRPARPGLHLLQ
jgi:hypothetical protein